MYHLCLAFSVAWTVYFLYLFFLHQKLHNIAKRFGTREQLNSKR